MNVKFPNNTSKWQIEFNSAFKGLNYFLKNGVFSLFLFDFFFLFCKVSSAVIALDITLDLILTSLAQKTKKICSEKFHSFFVYCFGLLLSDPAR
jgi:hypothetical protein